MLLLTLLLGCLVFFYARAIGGGWGGLLSTAVYASTPLFLGYGPLVHTDVTAAAFAVLTLFAAASLWRTPSRTGSFVFQGQNKGQGMLAPENIFKAVLPGD